MAFLARRFGTRAVLPIVERAEVADAGHYDGVPDASRAMATDERIHARVLAGLTPSAVRSGGIMRGERWHRGDASAPCGRPSSGSTTAWSPTWPWSWA